MLDITNFEPRQSKLHNPGTGKTGETFGYDLYNCRLWCKFINIFHQRMVKQVCKLFSNEAFNKTF